MKGHYDDPLQSRNFFCSSEIQDGPHCSISHRTLWENAYMFFLRNYKNSNDNQMSDTGSVSLYQFNK